MSPEGNNSNSFPSPASGWLTPERSIALQGLGVGLSQLAHGQPVNLSRAHQALARREQSNQQRKLLEQSGVLSKFNSEQRQLLAAMPPGAALKVVYEAMFGSDKPKTAVVNGRLVNTHTGELIADYSDPQHAPQRRIVEGADGRKYYADTQELVLPDMQVPQSTGYIASGETAAALGLDPQHSYNVVAENGSLRATQIGGGNTSISIGGSKQETEYDKTRGKAFGDLANNIQDAGRTAQRTITALDAMSRSMGDDGFFSGFGSGGIQFAKRAARALGFDADGIDSMEAFNAVSKQAALDVMGGSLGAGFSDADRSFVLDQVPGLGNTPEGNALLIEVQRAMAKRSQEIAKMARDYERKNGRLDLGFEDELAEFSARNPIFTNTWWADAKAKAGQSIQSGDFTGVSDDDLLKLLEGAQ
ncbi:hypothetical protein AAFO92_19320 [Roseovarius sp. CAU 1744]|uniref:hypothetical protein n=1 Tax=Roseovarius sp. CAU 1744 TaxID=3140368 RepID=UPI00325B0E86